jgi:hypothetical protein
MGENLRKKFKNRFIRVEMPDGSKWDVPVMVVARNRSTYYAKERGECGGDVEKHLDHDTLPYFDSDDFEILDWSRNNMNWSDVLGDAVRVEDGREIDFQEGWVNGEAEIVEHEPYFVYLDCSTCGYTYKYDLKNPPKGFSREEPGGCPNDGTQLVERD